MAGIRTENKVYEVGMYCRLSKDDGTDNESASIATQKSILTDYVKKQGWHLAKTYVDDGYSGTNFQRPSFQNMIKDIESGVINCVITKSLLLPYVFCCHQGVLQACYFPGSYRAGSNNHRYSYRILEYLLQIL